MWNTKSTSALTSTAVGGEIIWRRRRWSHVNTITHTINIESERPLTLCVCARVCTCGLICGQMKGEGWGIALEWSLIYMLMRVWLGECVFIPPTFILAWIVWRDEPWPPPLPPPITLDRFWRVSGWEHFWSRRHCVISPSCSSCQSHRRLPTMSATTQDAQRLQNLFFALWLTLYQTFIYDHYFD